MENNENMFELSAEELEKIAGGKNQKVRAVKAGVKIHELPGEKQRVIAKTTANAIANYTGELVYVEGKPWIKVKWDGKSGWILAKYVRVV
jgi:hypothetical protein